MVVRSWSELDFDNVCSNAKVFGFDLDNTLASSKQPMKPAMIWSTRSQMWSWWAPLKR